MTKMLFLGDICPDNNYRRLFDNNPSGAFCADVVEYFKHHDYVIANLECPATISQRAITKTGPNIKAAPNDIKILKSCGISHLSIANNHILDYGDEGVIETIETCKKYGIPTIGGGLNAKDAQTPLTIIENGIKMGIMAFAEEEFNLATDSLPGAAHFDPYHSLEAIANLKKSVDRIVILYHGGIEYYKYPSPELQKKCRAMIRAGADVILCQHSHCIGNMEHYNNGHILYGQGNTCFGWKRDAVSWNEGLAVAYNPEENNITLQLLAATENGVTLASKDHNDSRIKAIHEDSKHCYDPVFLNKEWLKFCQKMKAQNLPLLYGKSKWYNRLNRILKNKFIKWQYNDTAKMITLELMRCEAQLEVMKTILEDEIKFHTSCQRYR